MTDTLEIELLKRRLQAAVRDGDEEMAKALTAMLAKLLTKKIGEL